MKKIEKKTKKMLEIERLFGEEVEEVIRKLYVDDNVSLLDMCDILSISNLALLSWLKQAGIYSRKLDLE